MAPTLSGRKVKTRTSSVRAERQREDRDHGAFRLCFLGPAELEEGMQPYLLVYDDDKNAFWAICIKSKAVTQSIVKYYEDLLDRSGYEGEKIAMKSDQEPSILALKRAVAAARSGETVPIESPVISSKSKGKMEGAIGIWQGH